MRFHKPHWVILEETKSSPSSGSCLPQRPQEDAKGSILSPRKPVSYTSSSPKFSDSCSQGSPCYTPCCEMLCRETHGSGKVIPMNSPAMTQRVRSQYGNLTFVQITHGTDGFTETEVSHINPLSRAVRNCHDNNSSNIKHKKAAKPAWPWLLNFSLRVHTCPLHFTGGKKSC